MRILLLSVTILMSIVSFSQEILDSLLHELNIERDGEKRLVLISDMVKYTVFTDTDTALFFIEMYEDEAIDQGNVSEQARAENFKGMYHAIRSEPEKAIEKYLRALDLYKVDDDTLMIGMMYNNIGGAYNNRNDIDKEIEYFEKALEYFELTGNNEWINNVTLNLGIKYQEKGELEKARSIFFDGIDNIVKDETDYHDYSSDYTLGRCYMGLGVTYVSDEDYSKAIEYFDLSYDYIMNSNDNISIVDLLSNLCQSHCKINNAVRALEYADKCVGYAESLGSLYSSSRVEENYYLTYKLMGETDVALEYLEKSIEIHNQILDEKKDQQMVDMLTKYETQEKENQIVLQEIDIEKRQKEKELFVVIIIVAVLLLLSIGVLLYSRNKSNNRLKEQKVVIERALSEKELLLKEIHHRVKNNLQIVSSLLSIQSRNIKDEQAQEAVKESKNRVLSIALIHQDLYQEDNLKGIDVSVYFNKLTKSLLNSFNIDKDRVVAILDVSPLNLDVDTTIPLGLILNELLTNSLKYAFPDNKAGEIIISLKEEDKKLILIVSDNGVGIENARKDTESTSFGMKMIKAFAKKLSATYEIESKDGMRIEMVITKYKMA